MVFCFKNWSDLSTVRKTCYCDREKQLIQTVNFPNNFWNRIQTFHFFFYIFKNLPVKPVWKFSPVILLEVTIKVLGCCILGERNTGRFSILSQFGRSGAGGIPTEKKNKFFLIGCIAKNMLHIWYSSARIQGGQSIISPFLVAIWTLLLWN